MKNVMAKRVCAKMSLDQVMWYLFCFFHLSWWWHLLKYRMQCLHPCDKCVGAKRIHIIFICVSVCVWVYIYHIIYKSWVIHQVNISTTATYTEFCISVYFSLHAFLLKRSFQLSKYKWNRPLTIFMSFFCVSFRFVWFSFIFLANIRIFLRAHFHIC